MKRYKVKQVIKMEDRRLFLSEVSDNYELYFGPLLGIYALGLVNLFSPLNPELLNQGVNELVSLVMGSLCTLGGGAGLGVLFSAEKISDKISEKIDKIYEFMGDDFKKRVEQERIKQEYGDEERGRSR